MNTVIYYPEIPGLNWLKLAVLCWDKILLLPWYIDSEAKIYALSPPSSLADRHDWNYRTRATWRKLCRFVERLDPLEEKRATTLEPFFEDKLKDVTRDWMTIRSILEGKGNIDWTKEMFRMASKMTIGLAIETSLQKRCDLATDIAPLAELLARNNSPLASDVNTAILQAYVPADIDTIEAERILACREKLADKRLAYQQAIEAICSEFSAITSEGELMNFKPRVVDLAKQRIEDTRSAYREAKIEIALRSFGISLAPPAVAGLLASVLNLGIWLPGAIVSAFSIFSAKALIDWRRSSREYNKSAWSYVLDIERKT